MMNILFKTSFIFAANWKYESIFELKLTRRKQNNSDLNLELLSTLIFFKYRYGSDWWPLSPLSWEKSWSSQNDTSIDLCTSLLHLCLLEMAVSKRHCFWMRTQQLMTSKVLSYVWSDKAEIFVTPEAKARRLWI